MKEFVLAALPFIIIGICLAIFFARHQKKETSGQNYMTEGMCMGMALGVTFSSMFEGEIGLCLSLGMLAGMTVGMFIKKEDGE